MFAAEGVRYLRERILQLRILFLWLLLFAAVSLNGVERLDQLPWLAFAAALFVFTFRLWDDLADLEYDRPRHPQRILVRSDNILYFQLFLWLLVAGLTGLVLAVAGNVRALAFLAMVAVLVVTYRVTGKRSSLRGVRVSLVLAKYPVFVLLFATKPGNPLVLLSAFGVYFLPLFDEVRSTGRSVLLPATTLVGVLALVWLGLAR